MSVDFQICISVPLKLIFILIQFSEMHGAGSVNTSDI